MGFAVDDLSPSASLPVSSSGMNCATAQRLRPIPRTAGEFAEERGAPARQLAHSACALLMVKSSDGMVRGCGADEWQRPLAHRESRRTGIKMEIILFVVVGWSVGFGGSRIASWQRNDTVGWSIVLGMLGAVGGALIGRAIGYPTGHPATFVASVLGATAPVATYVAVMLRRTA